MRHVPDSVSIPSRNGNAYIMPTQVNHVCRNSGNGPPFRVRNFAFPGATAEDDLPVQFSRFGMSLCDAPLNGERTTYCAWCADIQGNAAVATLTWQ